MSSCIVVAPSPLPTPAIQPEAANQRHLAEHRAVVHWSSGRNAASSPSLHFAFDRLGQSSTISAKPGLGYESGKELGDAQL